MDLRRLSSIVVVSVIVGLLSANFALSSQPGIPAQGDTEIGKTAAHVKQLSNAEIEWRETTFGHAGPRVTGSHALALITQGVDITDQLFEALDRKESFVAAHVILTELWRVRDRDKPQSSNSISTGYSVEFNGLKVLAEWTVEAGMPVKRVTFPDLSVQQERLRKQWRSRYSEHPEEFRSSTLIPSE